jgi:hypothetical protein
LQFKPASCCPVRPLQLLRLAIASTIWCIQSARRPLTGEGTLNITHWLLVWLLLLLLLLPVLITTCKLTALLRVLLLARAA